VLYQIALTLTRALSPVLSFLCEEVYGALPGDKKESVFLAGFPEPAEEWHHRELTEKWAVILDARSRVSKALEEARQNKLIGSGLEAKIHLTAPATTHKILEAISGDLPAVFIVSQAKVSEGTDWSVKVDRADGDKCERCWNFNTEVKADQPICPKCVRALN
jgi:isoleucyl-tRNA synthetase